MNRAWMNTIIEIVDRKLSDTDFLCREVEWVPSDKILRLYIDDTSSDTGIDLDGCVSVTRQLSECEELDNAIDGAYNLEVSSPGIECPLRLSHHFRDAIGSTVRVELMERVTDRKAGKGRLLSVSNDNEPEITLETSRGAWSFPLKQLYKASVVYDWDNA